MDAINDGPHLHVSEAGSSGHLPPSIPKKVLEASYLTVPNAERYRVIVHFFYERYKVQQHRIKTKRVLAYVQDVYDPAYTLEQCLLDLKFLMQHGTLIVEQDRERVGSYEEWHNRDEIWDITEIVVRIEEALEKHLIVGGQRASLDPTLIESILAGLDNLYRTLKATTQEQEKERDYVVRHIRRPWANVFLQFDDLRKSTNAFHHALRDAQPRDANELAAFRIYKDILIDNLRGFINELVNVSEHLRALMEEWVRDGLELRLINILTDHDVQHVFDAANPNDPMEVRSRYTMEITAVTSWFQRDGGMEALRRTTRNAIDTVVRVTARITDRNSAGSSRRDDLVALAKAFAACDSLADAHLLGAVTLGSPTARHIAGALDWGLMTDSRSVWEQPAHEVPMRRIVRGRQPRAKPQPVQDRSAEQAALLNVEMERQAREEAAWDALFAEGTVELSDLYVEDIALRDRILEALDSCLVSEGMTGTASDGSLIQLEAPPPGTAFGLLRAPDGDFILPRFRMTRVRQENAA